MRTADWGRWRIPHAECTPRRHWRHEPYAQTYTDGRIRKPFGFSPPNVSQYRLRVDASNRNWLWIPCLKTPATPMTKAEKCDGNHHALFASITASGEVYTPSCSSIPSGAQLSQPSAILSFAIRAILQCDSLCSRKLEAIAELHRSNSAPKKTSELFAAQRDQGVDSSGALCRNVAGDQRDHREQQGNPGERDWVGRFHAE